MGAGVTGKQIAGAAGLIKPHPVMVSLSTHEYGMLRAASDRAGRSMEAQARVLIRMGLGLPVAGNATESRGDG